MTDMTDGNPYPISLLAMVFFGLSSLLDTGENDDISFEDVRQHSANGDLIAFLKQRGGGYFASNILDSHPGFTKWYVKQIDNNCKAMHNRERRKYGVEQRGLCLLISYTAEILQMNNAPFRFTKHVNL